MKNYAIYTWKDGQKSNAKAYVEIKAIDLDEAKNEFQSIMEFLFREEIEEDDVFIYTDRYLNYDTDNYELREV